MSEENTYLLDMFENLIVYFASDYEIPNDILEETMYAIDVELRTRDEERG